MRSKVTSDRYLFTVIFYIAMETSFLTFSQVKDLNLGTGEKPDYFNAKASIAFAKKDNCLYKACPNKDCNKKVIEGSGGEEYFCEKCNQNFPNFKYRLILTVSCGANTSLLTSLSKGKKLLLLSAISFTIDRLSWSKKVLLLWEMIHLEKLSFLRSKIDAMGSDHFVKPFCVLFLGGPLSEVLPYIKLLLCII